MIWADIFVPISISCQICGLVVWKYFTLFWSSLFW